MVERNSIFVVVFAVAAMFSSSATAVDIGSAAEFISTVSANPGGDYILTSDIDFSGSGYTPIQCFSGSLDGGGHTISNVGSQPLFVTNTGSIVSLTLNGGGVAVSGTEAGALVKVVDGGSFTDVAVRNYTVSASASGKGIGLFAAIATGGASFTRCVTGSDATVKQNSKANQNLGGFVGNVLGEKANGPVVSFSCCTNNATILPSGNYNTGWGAGGFVGYAKLNGDAAPYPEMLFDRCCNCGPFTIAGGNNQCGGLAGQVVGESNGGPYTGLLTFRQCENLSDISCSGNTVSLGGFAGRVSSCIMMSFFDCVNRGAITGTGSASNVGGFAGTYTGYFSKSESGAYAKLVISDCVNYGDVTAEKNGGGFIGEVAVNTGWNNGKLFLTNCLNDAVISANTNCAELVATMTTGTSGRIYCVDCIGQTDDLVGALNGTQPSFIVEHPRYYVKFFDWDDALLKKQLVNEGEGATAPENPSREGYSFVGWNPADFSNVTAPMSVAAVYQSLSSDRTVTFRDWDDTMISSATVTSGSPVSAPAVSPMRTGYDFSAWTYNGVAYDFSTPVIEDITLKAAYTLSVYPVTFLDWNGNQIGSVQNVPYLGAAVPPSVPTPPEDKVFKGWDKAFDSITGPLTVTALLRDKNPVAYVAVDGSDADGRGDEAHPFKTVKFAVASFDGAGGTVFVNPGMYSWSGQVELTAPVVVLGTTGNPDDVVLYNEGSRKTSDGNRFFRLNHAKAFVSGMTFKDGCMQANYADGGCIRIDSDGGCVSNCVFVNGKAMHFNCISGGAAIFAGLVTHCVFTGLYSSNPAYNADPSSRGLVACVNGADARLENSLFYGFSREEVSQYGNLEANSMGPIVSVNAGVMRNCTVVPKMTLVGTTSTDGQFKKWNTNGGCAIYCGTAGRVENCAVSDLKNIDGVLTPFGGTLANFYNCVGDGSQEISSMHNCRHATPLEMFLDPDNGDFHPRTLGALVNVALAVPGYEGLIDLAGSKRVVKILDVGCYESQFVPGLVITGKRIDN